jgi:hypothetical protein
MSEKIRVGRGGLIDWRMPAGPSMVTGRRAGGSVGHFDEHHATVLSDPRERWRPCPGAGRRRRHPSRVRRLRLSQLPGGVTARSRDCSNGCRRSAFVFLGQSAEPHLPPGGTSGRSRRDRGGTGKFWEMHDRLFGIQRRRSVARPPSSRARERSASTSNASSSDTRRRQIPGRAVHAEEVSGWHSHVLSTPTFLHQRSPLRRFHRSPCQAPSRAPIAQPNRFTPRFREARVRSTEHPRRQIISIGPHEIVADLPVDEGRPGCGVGVRTIWCWRPRRLQRR